MFVKIHLLKNETNGKIYDILKHFKCFSKAFILFVSQEVCHVFNKFLLSIDNARHFFTQDRCNIPLEKEYFPGYVPRENAEY